MTCCTMAAPLESATRMPVSGIDRPTQAVQPQDNRSETTEMNWHVFCQPQFVKVNVSTSVSTCNAAAETCV